MNIWERWQQRRALQAISDRLSRLEVRVAVTNREVAQIASQTPPVTYSTFVYADTGLMDRIYDQEKPNSPVYPPKRPAGSRPPTPYERLSWDPGSGEI